MNEKYQLSKEHKQVLNSLNLFGDEVGDEVPTEMQRGNLNVPPEEPEEKPKQKD